MEKKETRLLTLQQTAEIFQMSERTLYNKVRPNSSEVPFPIKPLKIGRLIRFRQKDIDDFLEG